MKVGVILSGCGVFDGSEIHEAVFTLLALDQAGATAQCMAPDRSLQTINHLKGEPDGTERNVLQESARISRGEIIDLAQVKGSDYDAFVLPGGFGAAKNLCTFATAGPACEVEPQVARVLQEAHRAGRPIGFICIAPTVAARVFGQTLHPTLTIGRDQGVAEKLQTMGARHTVCSVTEFAVDRVNRIVSTPAYMEARTIKDVFAGISNMVRALIEMVQEPAVSKP